MRQVLSQLSCILLFLGFTAVASGQTTDISSTPSSLNFGTVYVGKASASKAITINNLTKSGQIVINSVSFTCAGYGLASGLAPFTLGQTQTITHYSIYFQPTASGSDNCNFVLSLNDGTSLNVPLSGTGQTTSAVASVSPATLTFSNQALGSTSAGQTVTITNKGSSNLTLNTITLSPPSFTTNAVTLPATIVAGASLPVTVYYTPSQVVSETGAIDFTYNEVVDDGASLTGNGVASHTLAVSSSPTLPQATVNGAYQATLATSGGTGPYTWSVASGSSLPSGLTLSSAGLISGTVKSTVTTGNHSFTVTVTDSGTGATAQSTLTIGVFSNLKDSCNNISFNVPNTTTPMTALTDLGTGTYQGSEGGLYPNGSNIRPVSHDSDGVALAQGIQPLDSNGNPSPNGKYVLMGIGESTAQQEFGRFLPIANADPAKNPALVLVNGAQGGATPNNFTSTTSAYWATVLNNYLPQNGVTAQQVVAIWMEDTDGITTGSFPSDITTMQSQYETMMQTMLKLFPNLKMVYFSSRVYGGYSNGMATLIDPEPYAYEAGFAVKWAIQDQLNGNSNLNYNPKNGAVLAPWMSWGPYYWANGMLGRADGLEWDCADFSPDGTHPSATYGQLKVATALLNFLKTDDTTTPWYVTPSLGLTVDAGNNQSGNAGSMLPNPLTVLASNLNGGSPISGVPVTFSDGGAGGTFSNSLVNTGSDGLASTNYTLPSSAKTVTITATSAGYPTATFTETSVLVAQALTATAGNNQSGFVSTTLPTALTVMATNSGSPVSGLTITFSDGGAGGSFGTATAVTDVNGNASTTYTLPSSAKAVTISATSAGYSTATFVETALANVQALTVTSGNNQSGSVGTTLPASLTITATNNGNAVSGLSVTFSDGGAGGSFGTPTVTTGSNGTASTTYTLPASPATVTITASSSGYTSAIFTETATSSVTQLGLFSGGKQTGNAGTTLPLPVVFVAKNASGQTVAGATITFSDGGAGGTFSVTSAVTNSSGQASTSYTLPTAAKSIVITAANGAVTATASEKGVAGPAANFTIVSGNNQSANPKTMLGSKLVVSVADQFSNPISGATVTFTDNGAGGTFSATKPTTGTNGQASVSYTTGSTAGTVTITATTGSLTALNFTETVK